MFDILHNQLKSVMFHCGCKERWAQKIIVVLPFEIKKSFPVLTVMYGRESMRKAGETFLISKGRTIDLAV